MHKFDEDKHHKFAIETRSAWIERFLFQIGNMIIFLAPNLVDQHNELQLQRSIWITDYCHVKCNPLTQIDLWK